VHPADVVGASESATASVPVEPQSSSRLLVWIAWLVPVTLTLIGLIVLVTTRQIAYPVDAWGFRGYSAIFALTGATVGAIVLAHRPGNLIGRLFIALGVLATFQFLAEEYLAVGVIAAPGSLPAVEWLAWTMNWLWIPQFVIMVVFFLIFPDGRLLAPRWRAVLALAIIAGAIGVLASAFMPGPLTDFNRVSNPIGFASAAQYGPAVAAFRVGILVAFLLAAWSLVIRYRSAGPVERLQLRWVAFAATIAAVMAPLGFIEQEGTQALFILALCGLPVAAGVAILRYHLFEIDLLINRTLVYVTLTAILAGIYTASVTLMQRLFIALTGERSDAVFVLTTLVVVVVFTPVKNALQSVVDRRFKEIRDPTAPLGAFVARLQDGLWRLDPDLVVKRLLAVSVDSLAASGGVVALDGRTIERIGGDDVAEELTATAAAGTIQVTLAVGPRRAAAPYEDRDRTALDAAVAAVAEALASQAGGAPEGASALGGTGEP
jgi:hypothetical protein